MNLSHECYVWFCWLHTLWLMWGFFIAFPGQLSGYFQLRTHIRVILGAFWNTDQYLDQTLALAEQNLQGWGLNICIPKLFYMRFLCACLEWLQKFLTNWRICRVSGFITCEYHNPVIIYSKEFVWRLNLLEEVGKYWKILR